MHGGVCDGQEGSGGMGYGELTSDYGQMWPRGIKRVCGGVDGG